jgi:hypothetical protein
MSVPRLTLPQELLLIWGPLQEYGVHGRSFHFPFTSSIPTRLVTRLAYSAYITEKVKQGNLLHSMALCFHIGQFVIVQIGIYDRIKNGKELRIVGLFLPNSIYVCLLPSLFLL